jgi:hypothetical protein
MVTTWILVSFAKLPENDPDGLKRKISGLLVNSIEDWAISESLAARQPSELSAIISRAKSPESVFMTFPYPNLFE